MNWLHKNKVLVPIDFSESSLEAVDAALALVKNASHLWLVHVIPTPIDYEFGVLTLMDRDAAANRYRLTITERFTAAQYEGLNTEIRWGDPGHEIADVAESIKADLIVMPSHGRSGITRLLIGSVAERVVRLAHCPVLVLKAPAPSG